MEPTGLRKKEINTTEKLLFCDSRAGSGSGLVQEQQRQHSLKFDLSDDRLTNIVCDWWHNSNRINTLFISSVTTAQSFRDVLQSEISQQTLNLWDFCWFLSNKKWNMRMSRSLLVFISVSFEPNLIRQWGFLSTDIIRAQLWFRSLIFLWYTETLPGATKLTVNERTFLITSSWPSCPSLLPGLLSVYQFAITWTLAFAWSLLPGVAVETRGYL